MALLQSVSRFNEGPLEADRGRSSHERPLHLSETFGPDWLRVSWFYPADFKPSEVTVRANGWWVHGAFETLRFINWAGADQTAAASSYEKWVSLRRGLREELGFAQGLVTAVRYVLRHDEDFFLSERVAVSEFLAAPFPEHIADIALCYRNCARVASLQSHLEKNAEGLIERVEQFALWLASKHVQVREHGDREAPSGAPTSWAGEPILELLRRPLFERSFWGATDLYWRGVWNEQLAKLIHERKSFEELKERRVQNGCAGPLHGALLPQNVLLKNFYDKQQKYSICDQPFARAEDRWGDMLRDVARLVISFEHGNHWHAARVFKQSYRAGVGCYWDETFFRFCAKKEVLRLLSESSKSGGFEGSAQLALLFIRYSFEFPVPTLLILRSDESPTEWRSFDSASLLGSLCRDLAQVLGGEPVLLEKMRRDCGSYQESFHLALERTRHRVSSMLRNGQTAVVGMQGAATSSGDIASAADELGYASMTVHIGTTHQPGGNSFSAHDQIWSNELPADTQVLSLLRCIQARTQH